MNSLTDQQLLRDYTDCRSEAAFAELVQRYVDLVYSAALRMVRDAHLAEDVTQNVFVALAQNARQLMDRSVLTGWLHRTTQNLAANTIRSDVRRRAREQEAAAMNELLCAETDPLWERIAPQLDQALGELSEADRDALLLRYFQHKSAHEIAQTLGVSDDAAQKRVSRAVERMRDYFAKRGVAVGASGLVAVLSTNAVQSAPVGLSSVISTTAALSGAAVQQAGTIGLTKTLAMTTIQKTLIAATITVAVGTGIYEAGRISHLKDEIQTLQQQQAPLTGQIEQLRRQRDDASGKLVALQQENERLRRDTMELARLRGEVARLRNDAQELAQLKAADTNAPNDPTETEMKSWLSRVSQLKQHLERTPNQRIPELQFVTEQDWLNAAKGGLDTEADYRRALSALRSAAESKFVSTLLQPALKQYLAASNGGFPTDLSQLQTYFKTPVDDAVLQRWEIAPAQTIKSLGLGGDVVITQRAPVDDVYDTRFGIGPYGFGTTDFLSSLTRDTLAPVNQAFSAANNGKFPDDLSELLPYATTPEQKTALQKAMQRKAGEK